VCIGLNEPDAQARQCVTARALPVSRAALTTKVFQDGLASDAQFKVFADLLPSVRGRSFPALPSITAIRGAIDTTLKEVIGGKTSARSALAELQRLTQPMLDQDVRMGG
jgi:hypothetical protein